MTAKQLHEVVDKARRGVSSKLPMYDLTAEELEHLDEIAKIAGYDNAKSVTDQQNLWGLTVLEWVLEMARRVEK